MHKLINWYWDYGVKRGNSPDDPDRELRKISIGNWLDPLVKILDRQTAICKNSNRKACLALWGPSQTGKSTLLSRYIDGICTDGSDSALTWDEKYKTRFSPPETGVDNLRAIAPNTLLFNPYNHQSDASGVATRYTLKDINSGVDNQFPIEIIFTSRVQIIQSVALGYLSECERVEEDFNFTVENFIEEISKLEPSSEIDSEAYLLLKDLADAIEFMRGNRRFSNLFKNGAWDNKIRAALVSAPGLLCNKAVVEKFMARILWDSAEKLTFFYKKAEHLLCELAGKWAKYKILATMEVGALLLDIDTFKSYDTPEGNDALKIRDKVSRLSYKIDEGVVKVFVGDTGSIISGDSFGLFQTICAELIVPVKKEALEIIPHKKTFSQLIEKCDILDFPGVSNRNIGTNTGDGSAMLLDLKQAETIEIFGSSGVWGKPKFHF
jgi:hypothetical protein